MKGMKKLHWVRNSGISQPFYTTVRQGWVHFGGKRSALQLNGRAKWHRLMPQRFRVWSMTSCHAALACCNTDIAKLSQDSMSLFLCDSIHLLAFSLFLATGQNSQLYSLCSACCAPINISRAPPEAWQSHRSNLEKKKYNCRNSSGTY